MKTGEELALAAMKKELAKLTKIANRATARVEEYLGVGSALIKLREEFNEIIKAKDYTLLTSVKVDAMIIREEKLRKIASLDFMKLCDEENIATQNVQLLANEIMKLGFRIGCQANQKQSEG